VAGFAAIHLGAGHHVHCWCALTPRCLPTHLPCRTTRGARSALKRCVWSWHCERRHVLAKLSKGLVERARHVRLSRGCAAAAIHNTTEFFVLRILLGLAEGAAQPVQRSLQLLPSSFTSWSATLLAHTGCQKPAASGL